MVGSGFQFDYLDPKFPSGGNHSYFFIVGLILVYHTILSSQASNSGKCTVKTIASVYKQCDIHQDGVHDLECFYKTRGSVNCMWKPGNHASEKTYTLIIIQPPKYCRRYYNITDTSEEISVYESISMTVEVFEKSSKSTNCTKAVFRGLPKRMSVQCGPPHIVSFRRHSGTLVMNVSWRTKAITDYSVRYKALDSLLWNETSSRSQNREICTVKGLNSSLVYTVQIQCVNNETCSECAWSEAYTVPSELTTQPVIVSLEDTDIAGAKGHRLLSLTWKFSAEELHDRYYVTVGKASGEAPREQINVTKPEIRLNLSYSAYHLNISAVNNVSTSPAVSQAIPQREDMPSMRNEKLNVTVHSNTSFTIYWKDNLIKKYVCYSVEWIKKGHKVNYKSFYENANNYRTLYHLPEGLEPYQRYNITLHTRPDKDTCNMKRVNNSENTYGSTQFYFIEGSPVSGPANISSYNVTLNSVVLKWLPIPKEDIRGFLLGYIIYYTEYHHRGVSTERYITVDPLFNNYELGDLKSGTAYQVQISGFTRAGEGVRSKATCIFKTNEGSFNFSAVIAVVAVVASVLIFGSPIIKRAKVILWPSIPSPGNSNAMQKMEGPFERELLESLNTLKVEEWDTNSLQIVEKEDVIPASTLPSMIPLLHASEDDVDSPEMTCNWIQGDTEDATGDISPDITTETLPDVQRTNPQSSPFTFSSDYTTMEMFQQGMPPGIPVNTSVSQAMESEPEDTDLTVVKSGLHYIGQFSTSPNSDSKEMF
ncbi:leukemia inhibitory factor receptor isoform X1 [Epinephelus fuscoguttatus]|uniref:leukemia inhibitory factor receptor isoform X1 n=1 Tax=Epinephelus fuscoguttatus TaxID=293821 RepID=UPI0020D08338|nr:leukemia inhibitory factor receptor isoform X1 [Epinephelus fuscoguttatus]XP_049460880.1 leukemia inhibitory factor receptor isoform X1 [Epinephelus fuscoguttatus]